jgi:23S rRNA pseudouridine1911/1915/1917 synthase
VVTSEGVKKEVTLEDYLRDKYLENAKLPRAGIVHRLDKGTSGVMVIAKNNRALDELKRQFKTKADKKEILGFYRRGSSDRWRNKSADKEIKVPVWQMGSKS